MTTPRERTLKPWRRRLALRLLGLQDAPYVHRVLLERNTCEVWDQPNPNDLGLVITYTYGSDR